MTRLLTILLLVLSLGLAACAPDPTERIVERFEDLNALLEDNKEEPDALLTELEAFVEEEREGFAQDRSELASLSEEEQAELRAQHERALRRVMLAHLDVTLEIQERLRSHPEKLRRFTELMGAFQ